MMLFEQYRPTCWADVVGQDKAIAKIQAIGKRGFAGRSYWISGKSGTGKTTIAKILAAQIADDFSIVEIDGTKLTASALDDLEREMHFLAIGNKSGRAYIVNEAHGLRKDIIRRLLVILENIPAHAAIIFTTTRDGMESLFDDYDDAGPLLSRCVQISLTTQGLAKSFADRCRQIAIAESLDGGNDVGRYVLLAQKHGNNFRAMLNSVESGDML